MEDSQDSQGVQGVQGKTMDSQDSTGRKNKLHDSTDGMNGIDSTDHPMIPDTDGTEGAEGTEGTEKQQQGQESNGNSHKKQRIESNQEDRNIGNIGNINKLDEPAGTQGTQMPMVSEGAQGAAPTTTADTAAATADTTDHLLGITFETVSNDYSQETASRLIDLKNIFSRQLPKMPKEYIVRLVFDARHISLAMVRHGRTIGGICYRPYFGQRFGEIAFCAISSNEQMKGYGSLLMNHLKARVQETGLDYFLTYADNYAIKFFQRQGFTKNISMPKERWFGYIKDYDGGTLMDCYVHPNMDYLQVHAIVQKQRTFIFQRLQEKSESGTVYDGLGLFQGGERLQNLLDARGVAEAGWTSQQLHKGATERDRNMQQAKLKGELKGLLDKTQYSSFAAHFAYNYQAQYAGYEDAAKGPSSLDVVVGRLREGDYYRSKEMMSADLQRMIQDALLFHVHTRGGMDEGEVRKAEETRAATEFDLHVKELFDTKPTPGAVAVGGVVSVVA
jgi:N-acetylglutamate synthase-like GNAT family acetyltransferase